MSRLSAIACDRCTAQGVISMSSLHEWGRCSSRQALPALSRELTWSIGTLDGKLHEQRTGLLDLIAVEGVGRQVSN